MNDGTGTPLRVRDLAAGERFYICEVCNAKLPMTPSQFKAAGSRARCAHHGINRPRASVRQVRKAAAKQQKWVPVCDECGASANPRKSYRLEPRNLREVFALLCAPCRARLGFVEVDHTRPALEGTRAMGKAA